MRAQKTVNLVRKANEDAYRVVSDVEITRLKTLGRVQFEKARVQGSMYGYFYSEA